MLLTFVPPGATPRPIGVLLFDPDKGSIHWKFRSDWSLFAEPDDVEILACLTEDFTQKMQELGPEAFLTLLEDTLSNAIQITDRKPISIENVDVAVDMLFDSLVAGR
jgi:hypothetical protein